MTGYSKSILRRIFHRNIGTMESGGTQAIQKSWAKSSSVSLRCIFLEDGEETVVAYVLDNSRVLLTTRRVIHKQGDQLSELRTGGIRDATTDHAAEINQFQHLRVLAHSGKRTAPESRIRASVLCDLECPQVDRKTQQQQDRRSKGCPRVADGPKGLPPLRELRLAALANFPESGR